MDLLNLPLRELADRVKEKPDRLDKMPGDLSFLCSRCQNMQIFISFEPKNYFQEVTGIKEKLREGKPLPLAGATLALADNICTENLATTCGSRMLAAYEPPFHARVVENLRNQGVIIVGKTNMEEFGLGSWGNSSHYGAVKNPWQPNRTAGSGAAAAAATLASLALVSDTCGEARQSASYCGVLALKPSYGRISRKGIIDYAPSLAQPGIIARNTRDLVLALETAAGEDPADVTSLKGPAPDFDARLNLEENVTFRAAVPENWHDAPGLEDDIREAFTAQLEALKQVGMVIDFISLDSLHHAYLAASVISAVEAFSNLANFDGVRFGFRGDGQSLQDMYTSTRTDGFSSKLKQFLTCGALLSSDDNFQNYVVKSQKLRTRLTRELEECLSGYHLLLTPTTPCAAPLMDTPQDLWQLPDPLNYFTAAANLSGLPALSFPVHTASGLPAGLQLIGRFGDEISLLNASLLIEKKSALQFQKPACKDQGGCTT